MGEEMITADAFRQLDRSDRGGGDVVGFPEVAALEALVDAFAAEMKKKLVRKFLDGYHGWDDPECEVVIRQSLAEHVSRSETRNGQFVDIANLAAMLWNIERGKL